MNEIPSVTYDFTEYPPSEMVQRSQAFLEMMKKRHSVRQFAPRPVPVDVIENCLAAAGRAPSGANQQPWHFVVVTDAAVKHQIRLAAEEEERAFYDGRAADEWLESLEPLGTNANKAFIDDAGCLIVIFAQSYGLHENGGKYKHYYVQESVGIATGFLIAALHHAGLACLTHTPSPMNFLGKILNRPANERAAINLVVGYPAAGAQIPMHALQKKELMEIVSFF